MATLDNDIKHLLRRKLVRGVLKGEPFRTLESHRRELIGEVAQWMGVDVSTEDGFKNRLVTLLGSREVPTTTAEWTKLLNKWIRNHCSGAVLSSREIYEILAVDGFRGFKPKHLKLYLPTVPLRKEYEDHARGVRAIYHCIDETDSISGLTGTDSACVVFLALLRLYGSASDDRVAVRIERAVVAAEGHLQQLGEYYPDVKNVNEALLKRFGKIYVEVVGDSWKDVSGELLESLDNEIG